MKWDALEEEPCSLARTVAVIGDRWSLLILRECFLRIQVPVYDDPRRCMPRPRAATRRRLDRGFRPPRATAYAQKGSVSKWLKMNCCDSQLKDSWHIIHKAAHC